MAVTIWHNPRCSKSRQALALLEAQGTEVTVYKYLDENPTPQEIKALLAQLNIPAISLMRTGEELFKELGLKAVTDENALIEAMAAHPKLIERPIVINEKGAVIARPPENLYTLF